MTTPFVIRFILFLCMFFSGCNAATDANTSKQFNEHGGFNQGGESSAGQENTNAGTTNVTTVDFPALPEKITTNLDHFLIAGSALGGQIISVNNVPLSASALGPAHTFSVSVPLLQGENALNLSITSETSTTVQAKKTVIFDPAYSTADLQLVYVDVVTTWAYGGQTAPTISGTVVIHPKDNSIIGILQDKHIVGISPDGKEIYFSDRSAYSTSSHQLLRTLPFSADVATNGFLVSPDGTALYSRNQRLDVASNTLLANLPADITTGSSYGGAPTPGGPGITSDGGKIYCQSDSNYITTLDVHADAGSATYVSTGLGGGYYTSDLTVSPDGSVLLLSYYGGGIALVPYSTQTGAALFSTALGIGDFIGEASYLPNGNIISSSSGNPAFGGGGIALFEASSMKTLSRKDLPLADNNAISTAGEIFVSAGDTDTAPPRTGINVYVTPDTELILAKHFALGINASIQASGTPGFDQIRKIVIKE